jgi:hypothetical protein
LKSKKLKQCVVEGFLNLYLYQNKEKITAKGMAMCLGQKSVTLYLPFYNLIKEVPWSSQVVCSGKGSVTIKSIGKDGCAEERQISKNDSIDVEMEFDVHQEVKITMYCKRGNGEALRI